MTKKATNLTINAVIKARAMRMAKAGGYSSLTALVEDLLRKEYEKLGGKVNLSPETPPTITSAKPAHTSNDISAIEADAVEASLKLLDELAVATNPLKEQPFMDVVARLKSAKQRIEKCQETVNNPETP